MASEKSETEALFAELCRRVKAGRDLSDIVDPSSVSGDLSAMVDADAEMKSLVINGPRVDVVLSTNNDEWRVVFGTQNRRRIDWVATYRRPPSFAGAAGGRVVVVNGPSGVGKSTVLESLQTTFSDQPWVIFDEPEHVGSVRSEYLIWKQQTPTLQKGYLAAIAALAGAGNLVALAAGGRVQVDLATEFGNTPIMWVGLFCDTDVLIARERHRLDRWGGLALSSLNVHDGWHYDLEFDTTNSPDLAEIAAQISALVEAKAQQ